jgi:hypothetical protein
VAGIWCGGVAGNLVCFSVARQGVVGRTGSSGIRCARRVCVRSCGKIPGSQFGMHQRCLTDCPKGTPRRQRSGQQRASMAASKRGQWRGSGDPRVSFMAKKGVSLSDPRAQQRAQGQDGQDDAFCVRAGADVCAWAWRGDPVCNKARPRLLRVCACIQANGRPTAASSKATCRKGEATVVHAQKAGACLRLCEEQDG